MGSQALLVSAVFKVGIERREERRGEERRGEERRGEGTGVTRFILLSEVLRRASIQT